MQQSKYIQYIPDSAQLANQLKFLEADEQIEGIMILACDKNKNELDAAISGINTPVFGGVFPAILFCSNRYESGFVVVGLQVKPVINLIDKLNELSVEQLEGKLESIASEYTIQRTIFLFVDGLSGGIEAFIESLFGIFGLEFDYLGAGAGSLSLKPSPCIITNSGLTENVALLAGLNLKGGIGIKHGWGSIDGPFQVTCSHKNIIKELDFKPAFQVYKQAVEKYSGQLFTESNLVGLLRSYSLGIKKVDSQPVVRDILQLSAKGSLVCAGEVVNSSFVDLLTAKCDTLVNAAHEAASEAFGELNDKPKHFVFLIDCISRALFLKNDFYKELKAVCSVTHSVPVFGVLSIGEIANNRKDYLEFHNKTLVVGCF